MCLHGIGRLRIIKWNQSPSNRCEERGVDHPTSVIPVPAEPSTRFFALLNSAHMHRMCLFTGTYSNILLNPSSLALLSNPQTPLVHHSSSNGIPTREQGPPFANQDMSERCFHSPCSSYAEHMSWLEMRKTRGDGHCRDCILPMALTCMSWGGFATGTESVFHYLQHREGSWGLCGTDRKMEELK